VPPTDNWYQRAVLYEVSVRGFFDADDDGTGDLRGLTPKLAYLQWLGVDCLWPRFFFGPGLRDGSNDARGFLSVLPELGTLSDAVELVREVHRRGMRLIADLRWPGAPLGSLDSVLRVVKVWLDLGLDGFHVDVLPSSIDGDGADGDGEVETHELLKRLRKEVESTHPEAVLLGRPNWRSAELLGYFGSGDECHLCLHVPLVPQLFRALAEERAMPISEVLVETMDVPAGCQWALFLRNHDELLLDTVDDEQRVALLSRFAPDPRMRCNGGIRRRLASLLDNDTARTKLVLALLLSLAGSPILYYGDEIGMGDNVYLDDRDGLRTPMQWTGDRNAGFSRADFPQLYLPPLLDPVFGHQAVNVEAQRRDASSLLHWVRTMLFLRRARVELFGTGGVDLLPSDNPAVLAFVRQSDAECVLCVFNLSGVVQPVGLGLDRFEGCTPVELGGRVPFPAVSRPPYRLSLPPHGFYWFDLLPTAMEPGPAMGEAA
jgi:maltose alpha-D-glucosyltransferase/alpha-amylase